MSAPGATLAASAALAAPASVEGRVLPAALAVQVLARRGAACVVLLGAVSGAGGGGALLALPVASHAAVLPARGARGETELVLEVDDVRVRLECASLAGAEALVRAVEEASSAAAHTRVDALRRAEAAELAVELRAGGAKEALAGGSAEGTCRRAAMLADLAISGGDRAAVADVRTELLLGSPAARAGALVGAVDVLALGSRAPFTSRRRAAALLAAAALWPRPAHAQLTQGLRDRAAAAVAAMRRFAHATEVNEAAAALGEYLAAEAAMYARLRATASPARATSERAAVSTGSPLATPAHSAPADYREFSQQELPTLPRWAMQFTRGSPTPQGGKGTPATAAAEVKLSPAAAAAVAALGALAGARISSAAREEVAAPPRSGGGGDGAPTPQESAASHWSASGSSYSAGGQWPSQQLWEASPEAVASTAVSGFGSSGAAAGDVQVSPARTLAAQLREAASEGSAGTSSPAAAARASDGAPPEQPGGALTELAAEQLALARRRFEGAVAMAREYAGAVHTLRALAPTAELALNMERSVDEGARLLERESDQRTPPQSTRQAQHVPHVRLCLSDILAEEPSSSTRSLNDATQRSSAASGCAATVQREYSSPVAQQLSEAAERLHALRLKAAQGSSERPRFARY